MIKPSKEALFRRQSAAVFGPIGPRPSDWKSASIGALVEHVKAAQEAQTAELERLRRRLASARGDASTEARPARTLSVILACLDQSACDRALTSTRLLARLVAQGSPDHGAEEAPAELAHLLRDAHTGRENELALLEFVRHVTADFTSLDPLSAQERRLCEELAGWVEREKDRLRVESDCVVPRLVSLSGLTRHLSPAHLSVRRRELVTGDGRRQYRTVFCPAERRSVDLAWCRGCALAARVGRVSVDCTPDVEDEGLRPAAPGLGERVPVGQAMGRVHLSVRPHVRADDIARALKAAPVAAVLVVDEGDRLLGSIDASAIAPAPPGRTADELRNEGPCIEETAPLADAVECMAAAHARCLPVVDDRQRAVGVIADVDALQWVQRSVAKPAPECSGPTELT
jgi:CBS domain-containing protein